MSWFIINSYIHETAWNWLLNNLVSYYKFDNNMTDEQWYYSPSRVWATFVAWKLNQCLEFDWVNDYLDIWNAYDKSWTNYSYTVWVKIKDFTNLGVIISSRHDSQDFNNNYAWLTLTAAQWWWLYFLNRQGGTSSAVHFFWVVDTVNTWYHIVYTAAWTEAKMYVNWEEQTLSWSIAYWTLATNTNTDRIWLYPHWNTPFNWFMDEFWIYNGTLTQEQVTALYNWGTPLPYSEFTN